MTKTLEDIKREVIDHLAETREWAISYSDVHDAIDHLHSQGLLMVWNTDMDSAPRDGTSILTLSDWGVCEAWWNGYVWIAAVQTGSDEYEPLCCIPTTWMLLPKGGE